MEATVKDRQSLLDIAVQVLGGIEGVFALAERNGISITDRLDDGTELEWDISDIVDATVQTFYSDRGLAPATEITDYDLKVLLGEITEDDSESGEDTTDTDVEGIDTENGHVLTGIFTDEFDIVFA